MFFYIANFIGILIYGTFFRLTLKNKENMFAAVVLVHLTILSGLRSYSVGTDTKLYNNIFISNGLSNWKDCFSSDTPVYSVISKIIYSLFNSNYSVLLLLCAFITNFCIIYAALYFCKKDIYFVVYCYTTLYFYYYSLNTFRQLMAVSLSTLVLVLKRKYVLGIIILSLSLGIHNTAIVSVLLLIPIIIKKWSIKKHLIVISLSIIGAISFNKIFILFMNLFSHYSIYAYDISNGSFQNSGNKILLSIFYLLISLIGFWLLRIAKPLNDDRNFNILLSLLIISCIIGIIFSRSQLMNRMELYFSIYSIYYIPVLSDKIFVYFGKNSFMLSKYFLAILLLAPYLFQLSKNLGEIVPYYSIFS